MQIKPEVSYYLTPVRMVIIKKQKGKCWLGKEALGAIAKQCSRCGKTVWRLHKKNKIQQFCFRVFIQKNWNQDLEKTSAL